MGPRSDRQVVTFGPVGGRVGRRCWVRKDGEPDEDRPGPRGSPCDLRSVRTPLKHVARLLVGHRIGGLPVVDEHDHVIGVVSEADFLVKEQDPDLLVRRPLARIFGESKATRAQIEKINAQTAGAAMTTPALTILPRRIAEAAAKMTTNCINRLPVVDESGRLLGIVTRADLLRAFVRTDSELARTIREDVLLRNLARSADLPDRGPGGACPDPRPC